VIETYLRRTGAMARLSSEIALVGSRHSRTVMADEDSQLSAIVSK
jgi:hypothetical protein